MALVNDVQALNAVYNKWYMDEGGIIGDVELLKKSLEFARALSCVYNFYSSRTSHTVVPASESIGSIFASNTEALCTRCHPKPESELLFETFPEQSKLRRLKKTAAAKSFTADVRALVNKQDSAQTQCCNKRGLYPNKPAA